MRDPGGTDGERDPGREQRARSGDRPPRGQAHAGGAARAGGPARPGHREGGGRGRARALYTAMVVGAFATAPLPWPLGSMTAWLLLSWAAIPLAIGVVKVVR